MSGCANQVTSGIPSADCTYAGWGCDAQIPSTSSGPRPASRSAAMHACNASAAALISPPSRRKPVVPTPANAIASLMGLRLVTMVASVAHEPEDRERRAVAFDPVELHRRADHDGLVGRADDRARQAQTRLLLQLDGDHRVGRGVVDAGGGWALVQEDHHVDEAPPADRCGDDVRRPARGADGPGRMVPRPATVAAVDPELVFEQPTVEV